jgi:hypothetical protein
VRLHVEREVRRLVGGSATLARTGAIGPLFEEEVPGVSALVATQDRRPDGELAWLARDRKLAGDVVTIGDCESPRSAYEAVLDGALIGRSV